MRVVVTGASGNVGTSVLDALAREPAVDSILGIARRIPELEVAKTSWAEADVADDSLDHLLRGADAVVHLAWLIQPSRNERETRAVNVEGSRRVFDAVARAGVLALVYASSVGAYAPGPKDRRVTEDWPTTGIASLFYARHKAEVERLLDRFESEHEGVRVVRLRPGLIFKRDAASEGGGSSRGRSSPRRWFGARSCRWCRSTPASASRPSTRSTLARPTVWRSSATCVAPSTSPPSRSSTAPSSGVCSRPGGARAGPGAARRRRRDVAASSPAELFDGLRDGAGLQTPPLARRSGGPLRVRELLTGVGARSR